MLLAAVILVTVLAVWWANAGWRPRPLPGVQRPRPWLLAHRGIVDAETSAFENTRPALEAALDRLDGLETDVQRTRDGDLVLVHDLVLGSLVVRKAETAVLRDRIPGLTTLDTLFDLAERFPGRILNLEVKSSGRPWRSWALERAVVRAIFARGMASRVLVSSFDPIALARIRLLAPGLRIALLTAPEAPRGLRGGALARWLHVDALHPRHDQIDDALLERCRRRDLPVHTWTVNDEGRARSLLDGGVSALIGDDPDVLLRQGRESA